MYLLLTCATSRVCTKLNISRELLQEQLNNSLRHPTPSSNHRTLTNIYYHERAARSQAQSQRETEDHNGSRERRVSARDLRRTEHHTTGGHIPIGQSEQDHE